MPRAALIALATPAAALAGTVGPPPTYDFSAVTSLAQGAVQGQNVAVPVPGFELLIMKDGRIVYRRAFGTWSPDRTAQADSSTKTLSGAVIMSLVDSSPQPFSLDTTLSQYLPAFNTPEKASITVRQAFSHTSGLPSGDAGALGNPNLTLQQAAAQIAALPLQYPPPGSVFAYGGNSMHAAGAAAEVAGGQPFVTLLAQRVTGPLGMAQTFFTIASPANPRVAGGAQSNAIEFARLMDALRRDRDEGAGLVLSAPAARAMFTRQVAPGVPAASTPFNDGDYGVGVWIDRRDAQGEVVGVLAGGARGFHAWIDFDAGTAGAFATDLSSFANLRDLQALIRGAARDAVAQPICPPNCDGSTGTPALNALDFSCFLQRYTLARATPQALQLAAYANCDGSTTAPALNALDFACFLQRYQAGCP